MCGIVGTLSLAPDRFRVSEALLVEMRDTMVHRGPDGSGVWVSGDGRIGLGHRRLSIIDLSAAASQPMANEDASLMVVFNGEIYNHAELRKELEVSGRHRWRTDHSDTEVVLHAFEEWGLQALHRFRGMFSIALWDARKGELLIIRDRIGVKPLYWTRFKDRFSFASEIKALLADPEQSREIDETAFFDFLSFTTTPAPQTLFSGINKLEAGHWLRIGFDGTIEHGCWWDIWDEVHPLVGRSDNELAEMLLAELRSSVRLRKVSDVPSGIFLSGGVDSSTNLVLFAEDGPPTKAFSIAYAKDQTSIYDEMVYARRMAKQVGAAHFERTLTQGDLLNCLDHIAWLQDEPIADPVCVPVYLVAQLAKEHGITVCHVGEGADELFAGYSMWSRISRLERLNLLPVPRMLKTAAAELMTWAGFGHRSYTEFLARAGRGQPLFWTGAEAFFEPAKFALLSARLKEKFRDRSSWEVLAPIYAKYREGSWEQSPLHWMSYADLKVRLPELLLMRVDKMTMGASVEARVPFLDHKVVGLALSMPSAAKTRRGIPKAILKKAVEGLLPQDIIYRPKQGFAVPIKDWMMSGALRDRVRDELDHFCQATDLIDRKALPALFTPSRFNQLWVVFNLALWWRIHVARH